MARAQRDEAIAFARTVCLLGNPIASGGVTPFEDGSAEVWGLFSPLSKTFPKALFKACKQGIKDAVEALKPNPLWARADLEDEAAQRFLARLGGKKCNYLYIMERN